ncbi:HAD family hydrolase [Roseitalea porphyridii]|uniref:HAD family phosphatase n=1 Tax=Roseitalea porphyridii TaxID=1852022 RepID=A0A4P6UYB4_9HYPH|nr:HAD family phosphatase [Roseitalea porphyridii]QBK30002.1 HAD family phosphatase [Roseitalea porphyridii]
MTIRHIVFDIGKVLIHYDPELPYRRIIPDAERRTWFLANVCTSDWNLEQDRGRPWDDAEAELIAAHPDWETEIRAFRAHWHEMVPHAYDGTVSILLGLIEEGRDITFLTNFAADTFVEAQELYPFLKAGRGVTVSGRVRVIKPDPAIYDLHTRTFDLDPEATLFIDDNADNVDAARAFGWNAVRFENAEALQADLQRFDLRLD